MEEGFEGCCFRFGGGLDDIRGEQRSYVIGEELLYGGKSWEGKG